MKRIALLLCIVWFAGSAAAQQRSIDTLLLQAIDGFYTDGDSSSLGAFHELALVAGRSDPAEGRAYSTLSEALGLHLAGRYEGSIAKYKECIADLDALGVEQGMLSPLSLIREPYNAGGYQEERRDFFLAAIERYTRQGPERNLGVCHHGLGGYYILSQQYPLAIEQYMKARELFRRYEPEATTNATMVIGYCYRQWGNAERAETFLLEALQDYERRGQPDAIPFILLQLGDLDLDRGDTVKALARYRSARSSGVDPMSMGMALVRSRLIPAYVHFNLMDSAALELSALNDQDAEQPLPLSSRNGSCEVDYCNYLYTDATGNRAEANAFLERALNKAIGLNDLQLVLKYHGVSASRYRADGDERRANEHAMAYIHLRDSLLAVSNVNTIAAYEATVRDRDNALAIQSQQARLRQQRILLSSAGVVLLMLIALAWSVHRGKRRSDELLLNILPEEVAKELKSKGEAEAVHIDQVTVLFTDFKGFTAMSEVVTPRQLVHDLHECFSAFDRICEKYGIEKIKTIGDAYMAAGGLPTPNTTHATDVIKAALEMRDFIAEGKARKVAAGLPYFEIRIGIHTGPVVAGIVGVKKFQYDIWGDTVNTASRMESSGEVGQVNISEATYALVKDVGSSQLSVVSEVDGSRTTDHQQLTPPAFTFTPRGKVQAKGKGEMEMYFVARA